MRLDKYLSGGGVGSRKDVKELIRSGRVCVNGAVVKSGAFHICEDDDVIADGAKVNYAQYIYLMLNKPKDVVSATFDTRHKTVLDLVGQQYSHYDLFPVGRLDIDTTGLLLLTNDGALAHRLTSPKHHADKVYFAKVEGAVGQSDIEAFFSGVKIDGGYMCKSADLRIVSTGSVSEVELTIREGKFHQVKRMFEAVGKKVLSLKRLSMGGVVLDKNLGEGDIRELTEEEIFILKEI